MIWRWLSEQPNTHTCSFDWLSTLDGFNKIDNLISRVKELGMNAVAITDHGNLTEAFTFNKKCHEANIKPILGIEAYYTHDRHIISLPLKDRERMAMQVIEKEVEEKLERLFGDLDEKEKIKEIKKYKKDKKINKDYYKKKSKEYMYDTKGYHLILLAKNQIGWNNLVKLTSNSYEDGFFNGNGHVDLELLKKYSEGLICTSACISSVIAHNIRNDNFEEAEKHALDLKEIFGDDFYLEIQPLDWIEQYKVNLGLIELSNKHNIKLVASTDSHYTFKDDYTAHDILVCISTKASVKSENRMKYAHEYWIKNYDEMINGFYLQDGNDSYMQKVKEALENTNEIANKVENNIKLGADHELLPKIEVPKGYTPETWISYQCWQELYRYLNKNNLQNKRLVYEARLNHELNVIIKKGFASYILIVQDAIKFGDENGCPFGPGRG